MAQRAARAQRPTAARWWLTQMTAARRKQGSETGGVGGPPHHLRMEPGMDEDGNGTLAFRAVVGHLLPGQQGRPAACLLTWLVAGRPLRACQCTFCGARTLAFCAGLAQEVSVVLLEFCRSQGSAWHAPEELFPRAGPAVRQGL